MSELWRRLLYLFRRGQFDRDLEEEMRFHLEMKAQQNREAGMDADEARHAARRRFGNATLLKEVSREMWGWRILERVIQDLCYAARVLRNSPAFTAVAVVSLGLGIGANVAIFSLFNALMLRMLPVSHPEQLVSIYRTGGWGRGYASYPLYLALRDRKDLFDGVLARSGVLDVRLGTDRAEFAGEELVSGDYFQVLGIRPTLGRMFTSEDTRTRGAPAYVVLSYDFWRARFGGDQSILGRVIHVDEQPFTVIGVAQPGFRGVETERHADLWVPATMNRWDIMNPRMHWVWLLGRTRPGVGGRQLQAALDTLLRQHLAAVYGKSPDGDWRRAAMAQRLEVRPGAIGISLLREQFYKPLEILLAVVGLVLLVACANVAGLMMARGAARQREIALRFSLGASRARVLHQLLVESMLIAGAGGLLGLWLAAWGGRVLLAFLPGADHVQLDISADRTVFLFTAAVALTSALIFGLLPAFRATGVDPAPALKEGARGAARLTLRKAFVVTQVALSVVIVMMAGLFARSLGNLRTVDPGFHNLNVLSLSLDFPRVYQPKDADALRRRFLARMDSVPGVLATSHGVPGPYQGGSWNAAIRIPGSERTAREAATVQIQSAAPRYFQTIGSPLLRGREFDDRDSASAPKVAIVNEAFARAYFDGADAIGRAISFNQEAVASGLWKAGGEEPTHIIGLARDMRHEGIRERSAPTVYLPPSQQSSPYDPDLFVRTALPPEQLAPVLRREMAALDPSIAITSIRSLQQRVDDSIYVDRLLATVSGFFGMLALLLAGIGLYGVMTYAVTKRTGEIGIRAALGARPRNLLWMLLREGLILVLAGMIIGVPFAFASVRVATSVLYGIKARDPMTLAATAAVLLAVGIIAVLLPARRATRIDPIEALRYE